MGFTLLSLRAYGSTQLDKETASAQNIMDNFQFEQRSSALKHLKHHLRGQGFPISQVKVS